MDAINYNYNEALDNFNSFRKFVSIRNCVDFNKNFRLMAYNKVLSIFLVMQLAKMSSDLKTWVSDKLMSLLGYSQPTVVQYVITLCKVFYT